MLKFNYVAGGVTGLTGTNFEGAPICCGGMKNIGMNPGCFKYNKDLNSWSSVSFSFILVFNVWVKIHN